MFKTKFKALKIVRFILVIIFSGSFFFTSCTKDETKPLDTSIIPENFRVEIPDALMSDTIISGKNTSGNGINGNIIYIHLSTFIKAGDAAAKIVAGIVDHIHSYNFSQPVTFTFQSDEDNRAKNVVVSENSNFEGTLWQYQMNITDADSEGAEDKGLAVQVFWNMNPVKGIAIIKPFNFERETYNLKSEVMFRIDYTEDSDNYEQEMTVYISGLKLENPNVNPFSMKTLKMTVGKNGNIVKLFGNSNHPNARFYTTETGYNWAFVASGSNKAKIGIAEVGLPSSNLNSTDRKVILVDYSIKNVFIEQIKVIWPDLPINLIDKYLINTSSPGYYNHNAFVSAGVSPGTQYTEFETAIQSLVPYNPIEVSRLSLAFKLH